MVCNRTMCHVEALHVASGIVEQVCAQGQHAHHQALCSAVLCLAGAAAIGAWQVVGRSARRRAQQLLLGRRGDMHGHAVWLLGMPMHSVSPSRLGRMRGTAALNSILLPPCCTLLPILPRVCMPQSVAADGAAHIAQRLAHDDARNRVDASPTFGDRCRQIADKKLRECGRVCK